MTTLQIRPVPATQNGYAIRAIREKEGLSVRSLAATVGISGAHLRNLENEWRNASPQHLCLIARALGVPVAALQRQTEGD